MEYCSYESFIETQEISNRKLPSSLMLEAIKDISCRTAFVVYLVLFDQSELSRNKNHTISISHSEIAQLINASTASSVRAIRYLKEKGYIDVLQPKNSLYKYRTNIITVRFPARLIRKMNFCDISSLYKEDLYA